MEANNTLLEIRDIRKHFNGIPVLKGVSLTLNHGEIHSLVGGNGAGKSTLMKIITGLYKADEGNISVRGNIVHFSSAQEAHRCGIYLVPQEPLIFPNMTVEENILIGLPGKKSLLKEKLETTINRLSWRLDLKREALTLSIAEQQLVEILRGLMREASILILDEPTSTLTFGEINSLFKLIKKLTHEGMGIFYITHRMNEVFAISDTVSVLRDGTISAQGPASEFTYEKILSGLFTSQAKPSVAKEEQDVESFAKAPLLTVRNLSGKGFREISFILHQSEILGLAGVVGAGRTELAEAIFGARIIEKGEVQLGTVDITCQPINHRLNYGLAYVPEDRHLNGIFSIATIQQNISSAILYRLKGFFLPFKQERRISAGYIDDLSIKATGTGQELTELSGGNQQKVVLSKYLASKPLVIILDEPTRGIDAKAREDIYRIIRDLKTRGMAILLISSDMEEIEKLSDRVMVMHEGDMVKILEKDEIISDTITKWAFGVKKKEAVFNANLP